MGGSGIIKMTKEKAYVIGVICGDGCTHRTKNDSYQITLSATDKDFVSEFSRFMLEVYGIKPSIGKQKSRNPSWKDKMQSRVCSKEVFEDLMKYSNFGKYAWRVPNAIMESTKATKCSFLRGFFDSEGSVDMSKKLVIVSVNFDGMKDVKKILSSIGILCSMRHVESKTENRRGTYLIEITGRRSIESYRMDIGFSIRRKQEKLDNLLNGYKLDVTPHRDILKIQHKIEKLREDGYSYGQIAKELNIGISTAWNCINSN